jgi:hypothetical protein
MLHGEKNEKEEGGERYEFEAFFNRLRSANNKPRNSGDKHGWTAIQLSRSNLGPVKFYLYIALIGALMTMPVIGVWSVFTAVHWLPWQFRTVIMWGLLLSLWTLVATVDYARNQLH